MWDNSRPVKMLKTLRFNSVAMQHIIDVDKYIASSKEGYDLCQTYMPYCSFCNKWVKNPCAVAYFVGDHFLAVCGILEQCCVTEPAVIQAITDVDKYLVSETADFDVCGRYAPFCAVCDKSVHNPCATAYLRYKAMGLSVELPKIEQKPEQIVAFSNAATSAVAASAYEPEISVAAQQYMSADEAVLGQSYGEGGSNAASVHGGEIIIPTRRTGIRIARARRRLPAIREEDVRVN